MPLLLKPLTFAGPFWSLLVIGILLGVGMLWVYGRVSDQKGIRRTRGRVNASLMEMLLFDDEPAIVFRAQRTLLTENVRLLALSFKPALILIVPISLLVALLDPFYGRSPLPVGEAAVVTVRMKNALDAGTPVPALQTPASVAVETPGVRSAADREISWRIRPASPVEGSLRVVLPNETVEKTIAAGGERGYASELRASSWIDWLQNPGESKISSDGVESVSIRYPPANVDGFGFAMHWILWLLLISMIAALLLRKRMRVSL